MVSWLSRRFDLPRPLDPETEVLVLNGTREGLFLAALAATRNAPPRAGKPAIEAMARCGHHVGLAFQLIDDLLDVTAAEAKLGKPTDKQEAKLKAIQDLERLERIAVKVLTARSWDGLLRVQ